MAENRSNQGQDSAEEFTLDARGRWRNTRDRLVRPRFCPRCGEALEEPRFRRPRRVKVLEIGLVLWLYLVGAVYVMFQEDLLAHFTLQQIRFYAVLGVLLPGGIILNETHGAGRIISLRCDLCGWSHEYGIKEKSEYAQPDSRS